MFYAAWIISNKLNRNYLGVGGFILDNESEELPICDKTVGGLKEKIGQNPLYVSGFVKIIEVN